MSLIADAFQSRLVSTLFDISGRVSHCHIADALTSEKAAYDLDFDVATKAITVDFRETVYIGSFLCGDACRFASASFSSVAFIENCFPDKNLFPWGIIRMYYAAFYAGHAIIRLLGTSCSFLYSKHTAKITNLSAAGGSPPPFAVSSGLYKCQLVVGRTGLHLTQAAGRVGGAHEAFWQIFENFVSSFTEDIIQGNLSPADAQRVFAKLEAYRAILNKSGPGGAWLSAVRNDVQYRHAHETWTPSPRRVREKETIGRVALQWQRDPMDIDVEAPPGGELGQFLAAAAFSVALCRELLSRIVARSSSGRRSFAAIPLALCETGALKAT